MRGGRGGGPHLAGEPGDHRYGRGAVRAQDRNGAWFEKTGEDLCARAFCHEIDHLKGVLFTSHASRILSQDELDALLEQEEQDSEKGE